MRFAGYDHIDARVTNIEKVRAFYERLMPTLGLTIVVGEPGDSAMEWYEPSRTDRGQRCFFGIHENAHHRHTDTRIAFSADSREAVDRITEIAVAAGARNVEPAADAYEHEPYYASFFEDPDGTKLEICYRPGSETFPPSAD
jgi:predicted lactoylglutathione lyase